MFTDKIQEMKRWRLTTGHDMSQMDMAGTSLVGRVCGQDGSLSVATSQVAIVGEIYRYINWREDGIDREKAQIESQEVLEILSMTGPAMCSVCVLLWTLIILSEFRKIISLLLGVCSIPKGPTLFVENQFLSISYIRLAWVLLLTAVRAGVAIMLLITGILWLTHTSSISDLILNAAALHFIMDLDEMLYAVITPSDAQLLLRSIEPLPYKRVRKHMEAVVPLLLFVAILIFTLSNFVFPNVASMFQLREIMCGGERDFVSGMSNQGLPLCFI